MYREAGLISKYEAVYGNKPKMNYDFFSMMQHFVSYSPLIDFSENINIATVFATKRLCNFNDYDCTDGALFLLAKNDNLNHNNNIKRSISIHRGKVRYNSIIKGKPLYLCAISDFIPVFEIHDKKTSDRMRYQQGVFVDFKQAVFHRFHIDVLRSRDNDCANTLSHLFAFHNLCRLSNIFILPVGARTDHDLIDCDIADFVESLGVFGQMRERHR